jgi:hypothetical protein
MGGDLLLRNAPAGRAPYWEKYFRLDSVKDAHARSTCRDENGTEPWSCIDCDCTKKLKAGWKQEEPFQAMTTSCV